MNKLINHPAPCFSQVSDGYGGGQPKTIHVQRQTSTRETTRLFTPSHSIHIQHLHESHVEVDKECLERVLVRVDNKTEL